MTSQEYESAIEAVEVAAAGVDHGQASMQKVTAEIEQLKRHVNKVRIVEENLDAIRSEVLKPVREELAEAISSVKTDLAKTIGLMKAEMEKAGRVGLRVGAAGLLASVMSLFYGMWTAQPTSPWRNPANEQDATEGRSAFAPPVNGQFLFGNNVGGISLSPDGKWVAYVAWAGRRSGLRVRAAVDATGNADRVLEKTEGAAYPFWAPDSRSIGFFAHGELDRVDLADGKSRKICSVAVGRGGAWTDNDEIVFGSLISGLSTVPASGGEPKRLTELDPKHLETAHSWPQILPNGRFLYWVRSDNSDSQGVYAASLERPAERVLVLRTDTNAVYAHSLHGKDHLFWLHEGELFAREFDISTLKASGVDTQIAKSVTRVGLLGRANLTIPAKGVLLYAAFNTPSQFTWLGPDGKQLQKPGEPDQYTTFRVSPDGSRVAASVDRPGGTNLMLDVQSHAPASLTSDPGINSYPVWSPDGRLILYTASHLNLYLKELRQAESGGPLMPRSPNAQYATDWSGDGRWILYWEVAPRTQRDLWILPMTPEGKPPTDSKPKPYLQTRFNESWGRFSPEVSPKWIAYQSDASGEDEIYVESFPEPTGSPIKISKGGGQYPAWNPNGHELFYVSPDYKLMAVTLKHGLVSIVPSDPSDPHALFALPAVDIGWPPYDPDPKGSRILVRATPDQAPQPLTLIVNWPALLQN